MTAAECKTSNLCSYSGLCTAKGGTCVASSEAECRASKRCGTHGDCGFDEGRLTCAPASDADCANASEALGRSYSKSMSMCVGILPCSDSPRCLAHGVCGGGFKDVKTIESGSDPSKAYVATDKVQECGIGTDADCARSTGCAETGSCFVIDVNGTKVCGPKSSDDCKKSKACTTQGNCALIEWRCAPGSDSDCEKDPFQCGEWGNCTFKDGACVATAESCKASKHCATTGTCSLGPSGQCAVVSAADCKELCAAEGKCSPMQSGGAPNGQCVNTSDRECRASRACKEKKLCQHGAGYCVQPY